MRHAVRQVESKLLQSWKVSVIDSSSEEVRFRGASNGGSPSQECVVGGFDVLINGSQM